ncbi:MAG: hypothetical protein VB092_06200 [Oscillospiraceae bacterium]|nr:hypothetical protein [Oscillospiraceae bacterium]
MTENRISEGDLAGRGVTALDDVPAIPAQTLKEKFEELVTAVVVPKFNAVVDTLDSSAAGGGADQIGFCAGVSEIAAANAGAAIREVKAALDAAVLAAGNVPIGGSADQVLAKNSGADNDLKWATPLKRETYTAEITATWTGSAAPYTQEVAITGVLASDAPHITPVYSDTLSTAIDQKEAWAMVSEADAGAGKIIFTCFEDKPTVAIPIEVEVMR